MVTPARPRSNGPSASPGSCGVRLSLSRSLDEEDQVEEVESEQEDEATEPEAGAQCEPRRPGRVMTRSTAKRVQRFVLSGPGQDAVLKPREGGKRAEAFMTHLPDSPPKPYGASTRSIFAFSGKSADTTVRPKTPAVAKESVEVKETQSLPPVENERLVRTENSLVVEEEDAEKEEGELRESSVERPEVDESEEEHEHTSSIGPHAVDINPAEPTDTSSELESTWDTDSDSDLQSDAEDEQAYRQLQQARARFAAEQNERDALRQELETYVSSLASRCDDSGGKFVEFPKNFQQIVSLMTAQDIESDRDSSSRASTATDASCDRQNSWSQILIQNSLSKQQAYGTLDGSEDGADGEGSMAAKIALKMARIRQLDAVLEEKLGKNLYMRTGTKKVKRVNPQEPGIVVRKGPKDASVSTSRTARLQVVAPVSAGGAGAPAMNFVERNRQVVENGAKAKLTRDEEQRCKRLMCEPKEKPLGLDAAETIHLNVSAMVTAEFKLDQHDQQEIERLIAEKRGVYQSAVVMALNDVAEEDSVEATASVTDQRKANVVQETKRERLRKQRLQRIEEELKFLQENETVPILPDDDDDASDGCMSERSYVTTTSMLSTTSTRSGVTRRQLDQFVATEVTKSTNGSDKASSDEIQNLLRSLSHLSIATARSTTSSV